jgi:hypothetical protein
MTVQNVVRVLAIVLGTLGSGTATATASAQSVLAATAAVDTGARDSSQVVTYNREVFHYNAAGRRDPFVSLIQTGELRPGITDLRLTTVAYDATGQNSVAVLRDLGTKEQYRVKIGSTLGRMRVAKIDPKSVTFTLEEFGYSRQETLAMGDSTHTRTP